MFIASLFVVLLLAAFGIPLLALWADRKAQAGVAGTQAAEQVFRKRHGLSSTDVSEVLQLAASGKRAMDPRLRGAVAETAHAALARQQPSVRSRAVMIVAALGFAVGLVVYVIVADDRGPLVYVVANVVVQLALARRKTTRLRRAVTLNTEEPARTAT